MLVKLKRNRPPLFESYQFAGEASKVDIETLYDVMLLQIFATAERSVAWVVVAGELPSEHTGVDGEVIFEMRELDDFQIEDNVLPNGWRVYWNSDGSCTMSYPQLWNLDAVREFCDSVMASTVSDLKLAIKKAFCEE